MSRIPVILIAATLFAVPVMAREAAPAKAPASHQRAAAELLEVMHVEKSINESIDIILKAQIQGNPGLGQFEDLMRAFFTKYMAWNAVRDDYIRLYTDTFSEMELREMLGFYRTVVGQKLIVAQPLLMTKGAAIGQARVTEHLGELEAEVRRRVESQRITAGGSR